MKIVLSKWFQKGVIFKEQMIEPSDPQLSRNVSFECRSWDVPLTPSLMTLWEPLTHVSDL